MNAGSVQEMNDLSAALTATKIIFDDILNSTWEFDKADEALQCLWEGKQVGKIVNKVLD